MDADLKMFREDWIKFFEVSYDGIIIADGEGRIVYMNPASERLEEVEKEYILGRLASDLEREGIYEVSVTVKTLKEKKTVSLMQYKGGKQLVITGIPITESGKIKWVYINERDVTELNKVKRDSQKAKARAEKYKKQLGIIQTKDLEVSSNSPIMEKTMDTFERIAPTDISVMIEGESGVGKDVHARWIHQHSLRKEKTFIKIDCGTLSETLLESELFGYEKGAFTGANREGKKGLVEVADGGTLFLDEIGEMPLGLQAKLLRLIQDKVFVPVGGLKEKRVDIRIIAATNRNLRQMVNDGLFRSDLYYRLNVVPVKIPALRERREDIFFFIHHFLKKFNDKYGFHKTITNRAINILCKYDWPGNVRELSNVMERLVVVTPKSSIDAEDAAVVVSVQPKGFAEGFSCGLEDYGEAMQRFERYYLQQILNEKLTLDETALRMGISVSTLKRKLKKYKLRGKDRFRNEL